MQLRPGTHEPRTCEICDERPAKHIVYRGKQGRPELEVCDDHLAQAVLRVNLGGFAMVRVIR